MSRYFYALGRRKSSTARVRLIKGKGNITINTKPAEEYVAGMETIFDSAVVYNNESEGGFNRVGLPNQVDYNVQVPSAPSDVDQLIGVAKSVLFNPIQAGSILFGGDTKEQLGKAGKATTEALLGTIKFVSVDFTDAASIKMDLAKEMSTLQVTVPDPAKAGTETTGGADNEGTREIGQ